MMRNCQMNTLPWKITNQVINHFANMDSILARSFFIRKQLNWQKYGDWPIEYRCKALAEIQVDSRD